MHTPPKTTHLNNAAARLAIVALISGHALAGPPVDRNAWHFDEWSSVIVLTAGSYRCAEKGVEVKGGNRTTIGPNVLLENFRMRGMAPRSTSWSLERSLLRNSEIGGDFETSLHAKDCAFDNCWFGKTGGWTIDYWSTGWAFENCVFTKRFMGNVSVRDSSVRAVKCTFYDVTLPGIGYPADASGTAQCNQLRFEQCKFVKCVVPETFLASPIRCAFEDCTFPGPAGADWSKSKKPITVNAFIAGRGSAPVSYANTQLRVVFKTGSVPVAGANIRATCVDGKLDYPAIPTVKEALVLGDIAAPIMNQPAPAGLAPVALVAEAIVIAAPAAPLDPIVQSAIAKIEAISPTLVRASRLQRAVDGVALPAKALGDELFKLKGQGPQMPPATLPYMDALLAHTDLIRAWQATPPQSSRLLSELTVGLETSLKRVAAEREKLHTAPPAGKPALP